ncbi:MAG TPA: hypothetical protein DDZ80_25170 [Cyanobacteria bacterium UBA8803]|nr:hypothetical protein [Cyanobacteria bacterium UBA9273]HBL61585.1 hypothetical protein [Cyanobacteria bacterium UBA8803]
MPIARVMHLCLKYLNITVASWYFSLALPQPLMATALKPVPSDVPARTNQDLETEAERLFQEGTEQLHIGQRLEAAHAFEQALAIYRQELGNPDRELKILTALADAYNSLGKYEQAIESAQVSLVLAETLQNDRAKATASLSLANAYQSLGLSPSEYQKAKKAAITGLTTAWQVQDRGLEAKALAILGSIYQATKQERWAIAFATQGLQVAEENNISSTAASSRLTLAGTYLNLGYYQRVIAYSEQGWHEVKSLHQPEVESATSVMLGIAYLGVGNAKKSRELAEAGLAKAQEINSPLMEALALIVLSLSYHYSEDSQTAIDLINQSRIIAKGENNRNLEGLTLEVAAEIYRNSHQIDLAIAAYQEAIALTESYSAKAGLARIYQGLNLLGTASTYYKQAINKNEKQVWRRIPGLPIWLQASFPQAIQDIQGVPTTDIYRSLTNLLLLQKRMREAQQILEILPVQELREYTGDSLFNEVNSEPISLAIAPVEEQILKEYGSLIAFGSLLEKCQQTRCPKLAELSEQRQVLTQNYYQALERLENIIRNNRRADDAYLDPNELAQKAQQILSAQPNTLLIYPLVLKDKTWLLWVSQGGILKTVEVTDVTQTQLEITVLRFRQLLQNRLSNIDELQATSKQLYDWLIAPLETELKANDIRHLVFALDRSTRYIPMSALFDGKNYLIENYTVSTVLSANFTHAPSILSDRHLKGQDVATSGGTAKNLSQTAPIEPNLPDISVLALGVSKGMKGFQPMPNVSAELDTIVRQDLVDPKGIYPGQKFIDENFDLWALRDNLSAHNILHIATHGEFLPGPINRSYLLLGTGEKLAIPDIETWLDLRHIDLVVLSSCETALGGPGLNGREIAAISYYFLKGGAKTAIASLWNVNDRSTRLLMEQFYQNLAGGTPESPIKKAEALRQAQLALLTGKDIFTVERQGENRLFLGNKSPFSHPYYWSSFILMGL